MGVNVGEGIWCALVLNMSNKSLCLVTRPTAASIIVGPIPPPVSRRRPEGVEIHRFLISFFFPVDRVFRVSVSPC